MGKGLTPVKQQTFPDLSVRGLCPGGPGISVSSSLLSLPRFVMGKFTGLTFVHFPNIGKVGGVEPEYIGTDSVIE